MAWGVDKALEQA
jgi:hypothetical protein